MISCKDLDKEFKCINCLSSYLKYMSCHTEILYEIIKTKLSSDGQKEYIVWIMLNLSYRDKKLQTLLYMIIDKEFTHLISYFNNIALLS